MQTSTAGIGAADSSLRRALATGIGWSALVLAILAVIAGAVFARRITRPVAALTDAARAMASGERGVRVADVEAPGELGDLSRTFNHMADTLELEDQLRRVLVADVAHELRTPLAILQATTEAMADGITEPTAGTLSSLHDETLRLGRIVEDLEVLASAEAAGLSLELKPVDLALVAEEAAEALKAQFEGGGISLTCHLRPAVVRGDKNRLHQVVTNLLTNAIKFTPAGGSVNVSVFSRDQGRQDRGRRLGMGHTPGGSRTRVRSILEGTRRPAHHGEWSWPRRRPGAGARSQRSRHCWSEVGLGAQFVVTIPSV